MMKKYTYDCLIDIVNDAKISADEKINWIKKVLEIEKKYLTD